MDKEIFTKNLLDLVRKHDLNARSLANLINTRSGKRGEKVIEYSYIAKMIHHAKKGEYLNPSLDKAGFVADGFGLSLADMLQPNLNIKGYSPGQSFNTKALEDAFVHVESICDSLGITEPQFKARALEIQYQAIISGDTAQAAGELIKLSKLFNI